MTNVRYKVVPPARSIAFLRKAAGTLPLVPGSVEDCCSRIRDGTTVTSRDEAREYLTFLQALGLAAEADRGFHRVRDPPTDDELATAFKRRVFGGREVLDALDGGPVRPEVAFDAIREEIPEWERDRHTDWEAEWRERVEHLLEWAVTFGLATAEDGAYRRVASA